MNECSNCQPIRKANDELTREIKELEFQIDGLENKLLKADRQIGRLQGEIRESRAPRFSPG